jgi:hypothetical protein
MRYIITQSQFHKLVYKYIDTLFEKENFEKIVNPYVKDGNTWRIEMFSDEGKKLITYFWYGPGEYDDGTKHEGIGSIYVHHELVDTLRNNLKVRESKILDIISDWVSEKFNADVDEVEIHPKGGTPTIY